MVSEFEKVQQSKLKKSEAESVQKITGLAASWYVAMQSKDLKKKPKAIELFGQLLVAWRDQNGQPVIMERFCSHMGASLAIGQIKEGCIQCPFHHWRFDSSGKCVSIPEVDDIPPTARQTTYVVIEKYGYIWVWYGSQTPLFPLPDFPAVEEQKHDYMPWRFTYKTQTTVRRVLENIYDHRHIVALHNLKATSSIQITLLNEQHYQLQSELPIKKGAWLGVLIEAQIKRYVGIMGVLAQALGLNAENITVRADAWAGGHIVTVFINGKERYKVLNSLTPVNQNESIWEVLVVSKKTSFFLQNLFYCLVFGLQNQISTGEDVPVWNTMKSDGGGAYIKHDRAVLKFREFYQTWVDKVE